MTTAVQEQRKSKTYDMVYISIFTVIIAVCSWIFIRLKYQVLPASVQFFQSWHHQAFQYLFLRYMLLLPSL